FAAIPHSEVCDCTDTGDAAAAQPVATVDFATKVAPTTVKDYSSDPRVAQYYSLNPPDGVQIDADEEKLENDIKAKKPGGLWRKARSPYDKYAVNAFAASGFLINIKGNAKLNKDCTCDFTNIQVTLYPYKVIYT